MSRLTYRSIVVVLVGIVSLAGCVTVSMGPEPYGPVLSFSDNPATSVVISWFDAAEITGVEVRAVDGTSLAAGRTVSTYLTDREGAATRGFIYGLEPETEYQYRSITAETEGVWRTFTTQPEPGSYPTSAIDDDDRFSFAVAGDVQPFNEETVRTTTMGLSKVASLDPGFVLQIGDVSEVGISRRSWRVATSVLSEGAAETPFVMTAGNHDYYYGLPSARNFKSIFPAPYAGPESSRKNTWYSVTIGPIHIAVLDTEADGERDSDQIRWLEEDLSAARDTGIEWLFIAMHRNLLASATVTENPVWAESLMPLVAEYEVAAVFWGHDHLYEHYEFQYGENGYVFQPDDPVAESPAHLFTVGTIGARVDCLYRGFLTHKPFTEEREMYNLATGEPTVLEFIQHPWNAEFVRHDQPGVRYQDPEVYPEAASYYSFPFDTASAARDGIYSTDPTVRYNEDAEFFGYTYGETSIHYLWVEVEGDTCTITAHYVDGPAGEHGTVITRPDGVEERWTITRP